MKQERMIFQRAYLSSYRDFTIRVLTIFWGRRIIRKDIKETKKTPLIHRFLPWNRRCFEFVVLQQNYAVFFAGLSGVVIPEGNLYFSDMGFAKEKHGESGLSDTAAHGEGKLAV